LSAKLTATPGKVMDSVDTGELLARHVKDVIARVEPIDAKEQRKLYSDWAMERESLLYEQVRRIQTEQKKLDVARRLLDLKAREEKLRYFDEQTKMDLAIADQPKMRPIEDVVEEEQFVAPPSERPKTGADAMKKTK